MAYTGDPRADVPVLVRDTTTAASAFLTLLGCLVAIAFLLTPYMAIFADFAMLRLGCIPGYVLSNFPPPPCVVQWNYECEKSLPNGNLNYSMSCTSSSTNGQFVGVNCSFSGLSSSVAQENMATLMINASCRVVDVQLPVATPKTNKSKTWLDVLLLIVFGVIPLLHIFEGYQLQRKWCSRRSIPGYPQVTVSRLRYQLAMERFAKYFFLATLTVALVLPALYYRLSCRVNDAYWFVFLFYCVGAQVYTVFAILDLEFFEQLPDSVFESGRIDREKINRIKKQKEQNRRSAALEERQRNCAACRGTCKYCYRQLDPFPQ
ncbi:hypothetical protein AAVH_16028 [Aphelenchoides avenae]|nr:hypothetical protein AAVH_16028 [Aphelenchus avenae]